jgi:hypothetical protein
MPDILGSMIPPGIICERFASAGCTRGPAGVKAGRCCGCENVVEMLEEREDGPAGAVQVLALRSLAEDAARGPVGMLAGVPLGVEEFWTVGEVTCAGRLGAPPQEGSEGLRSLKEPRPPRELKPPRGGGL